MCALKHGHKYGCILASWTSPLVRAWKYLLLIRIFQRTNCLLPDSTATAWSPATAWRQRPDVWRKHKREARIASIRSQTTILHKHCDVISYWKWRSGKWSGMTVSLLPSLRRNIKKKICSSQEREKVLPTSTPKKEKRRFARGGHPPPQKKTASLCYHTVKYSEDYSISNYNPKGLNKILFYLNTKLNSVK